MTLIQGCNYFLKDKAFIAPSASLRAIFKTLSLIDNEMNELKESFFAPNPISSSVPESFTIFSTVFSTFKYSENDL